MYYELTPTYGRDYKTKAEVTTAFNEGKDFAGDYQMGFAYCSKADFKPGDTVLLRYKRNTMVTSVKVTATPAAKTPEQPKPLTIGAVLAHKDK